LQQHPLLLLKKELSAPAQQAIKHAVALVGWPHDTLTSIDQNAHDLARLIDERLSELSCKIIFVCHSRGGLVARAAAEKLYAKDKSWETRIAHCITFGTPHAGVALAEHPDRRLGFYVLAGLTRRQLAGLIDISAYLEQRDHIEGIENLQPPSARGTPFLRQLEDVEWRAAPRGRKRRLDVYAIGGVAQLGDKGGPLLERLGRLYDAYQTYYTGEIQSDLVVPLSSATAANNNYQPTQTSCDHFSYFNDGVCAEQAIWSAIRVLWEGFGLTHSMAKLLA
jgi:pimeloyl-ACP methyl ester carboxylesterase